MLQARSNIPNRRKVVLVVMISRGDDSKLGGRRPSDATPLSAMATRHRTPKQSELIARDLASYIVDADLAPGTALPPEREMMQLVGVGRTTLREALRLLETRGVLTIRPGPRGGPIVRRPEPADLSESLSLMLEFEKANLRVMMDARSILEPAGAGLAAGRITPETIATLRGINQNILDSSDDMEAFFELNREFHRLIAEASGNIVIQIFAESIIAIADGQTAGMTYQPRAVESIAAAHEVILQRLEAGDPLLASSAMAAHLDDSHEYWRRHYSELLDQPISWSPTGPKAPRAL